MAFQVALCVEWSVTNVTRVRSLSRVNPEVGDEALLRGEGLEADCAHLQQKRVIQ